MIRGLAVERIKAKGRFIWMPVLMVLAVQTVYELWALSRIDSLDYTQGWAYFLYQLPLINCFMMPITIFMVASRLADAEHKGETFRMLHTLQAQGVLFNNKLLYGLSYVLMLSILQMILVIVTGCGLGFGTVPWVKLGLFFVNIFSVGSCIYLLAQIFALLFRNQAISLVLGIGGSIMGLFALFFPVGIQKLVIFAYYGVLCTVTLDWNENTRVSIYNWRPFDISGFLTLAVMFVLLYIIGRILFARKEY